MRCQTTTPYSFLYFTFLQNYKTAKYLQIFFWFLPTDPKQISSGWFYYLTTCLLEQISDDYILIMIYIIIITFNFIK